MALLEHFGIRVAFRNDKNLLRANLKLWTLGEQLEKWRSVDCQLCYICGDMGLDNEVDDCTTAGSVGAHGNCGLCTETICGYITIGLQVSDASAEEEKNYWKQVCTAVTNTGGLCSSKPATRSAILTPFISRKNNVDLTIKSQGVE